MGKVSEAGDHWSARRGRIRSSKGGWIIGEGVSSHGYDLLNDLVGHASFFQVLALNVTGRMPEPRLGQWLEATFICLSWPDPRIWCNTVGALGGQLRVSPVAAVTAGCLASDSALYGPGTVCSTVEFLEQARLSIGAGSSIEDFVENHCVVRGRLLAPGFARPIASGDERVEVMQALSERLGYEIGPMLQLAYDIEDYLQSRYGERLNLGGYMCAFLLDLGYSAQEGYRLYSLSVNSGVHACYTEYRDQAPDQFLPLRCDDIEYTGVPERAVPSP